LDQPRALDPFCRPEGSWALRTRMSKYMYNILLNQCVTGDRKSQLTEIKR